MTGKQAGALTIKVITKELELIVQLNPYYDLEQIIKETVTLKILLSLFT